MSRQGAGWLLVLCLPGSGPACAARPPAPARPAVDPGFEPAFQALRSALDERDDALAERVLARILARDPKCGTRAQAEAFGRILRGRSLARSLDLALIAEDIAPGDSVRLVLVAQHDLEQPLELRSGPATLRVTLTALDAAGGEERRASTQALPELATLLVPPGAGARWPLGEFAVPTGRALGALAEWDLELQQGVLVLEGLDFPASEVAVAGCQTLRLATWLPASPVEPGELVRYVEAGARSMPALVERTVRIDPARREEALDLLTPSALSCSRLELARLVPTLRWLSQQRELGADVDAWRAWLSARLRSEPPALDLPARRDREQEAGQ